jgi:alkylation response protein AidB-like acyl-CoA dehydrogenase
VLYLTDELELFRAGIRARSEQRIASLIDGVDRSQSFSAHLWDEVRALELFGLALPREVGGSGGSFLAYIVALEEVARVGASAALLPGTTVQVARVILDRGSDAQITRFVPRLASGEELAAWAFTEPQTGSDPRQLQTRASRDGEEWVLDGQKLFISFARQAAIALVFARTDDGVGAFLVDTSDPGWSTGPPVEVLGLGGSEAAPVYLDGVRVPAGDVIGVPGEGFDVMLSGEAEGKVRAAAICVGIAARAVDEATTYALARGHRGEPIGHKFPSIRLLLGEMEAGVLSARALVRSVADLIDRRLPVAKEAAAARVVAGRVAREVTSSALQVGGAYGWTRDLPLERLYREGKFFEVTQGVAEIQKLIVGRQVLAEHEGRGG